MSNTSEFIKQRLSLREPLKESLDILKNITNEIALTKTPDLAAALAKINSHYPTCTDFERDFVSVCFSIATGVGKTRLMGAFITYLYLQKGIRNFFVLAPNLTIYDKLIEDFGNPANPKYVFNGISEFVHSRPVIITGDNYNQQGRLFAPDEVCINVFNIAKFNSDNKTTKKDGQSLPPRLKRLSEYLGESYWQYLSKLTDLVILMDEAHRYHADASKNAINELKPVLGLELTATPIDEKGKPFRNVVYEYSLAKALDDGKYVKNPAIATRKDFVSRGLSEDEIEKIKLEDAISVHEDTKTELEVYSANNNLKKVKPFILVVCRDIKHAKQVYDFVSSGEFYKGEYAGKVLQIDSSTKTEEIEKQFLSLEHPDNEIEIVIHVNMLKEGWDVTNLYTIVPLRAANASVLIEQTIGRGLRLPFNGERTGVDKIDKLTIVAHDNFEAVIAAAQNPASILNKITFTEISNNGPNMKTMLVSSVTRMQVAMENEAKAIEKMASVPERMKAKTVYDAKRAIIDVLPTFNTWAGVSKVSDLERPEVKEKVIEKVREDLYKGQLNIATEAIMQEAEQVYKTVVTAYKANIIEIPRMVLRQGKVKVWFEDFDLDTDGFNFGILAEEIIRQTLTDNVVDTIGVRQGAFNRESPQNQIIAELINFPEVDYETNSKLLLKLSQQAVTALQSSLSDKTQLHLLIRQYRRTIAEKIYRQMKPHLQIEEINYPIPKVLPFVKIEDWNFSTFVIAGKKDYREVISPVSTIPRYVFTGFEKACHFEYKFDSKTEKDFASICENDKLVIKWMRPAPNQLRIYYANNASQYNPDFIVETDTAIYMVETKSANEMESPEVHDKMKAALGYCKFATDFTTKSGGKPWSYLLIPHNEIGTTNSMAYLISRFRKE